MCIFNCLVVYLHIRSHDAHLHPFLMQIEFIRQKVSVTDHTCLYDKRQLMSPFANEKVKFIGSLQEANT